jgi:probable O-glycosylation ligase (exosortase A-associated)
MMSGGLATAVSSRFGALLVYLWFALFRPQEWMWIDISSLRLSLVLGLLLVGPSLFSGILPNLTHPLSLGSLAFLLLGVLAQVNAVRPDIGWQWLDFLGRLVLVSLFLVTMVNSKRRFVLTVAVISGSLGYFTSKAGLASFLSGGIQFGEGLAGAFGDNNGYGLGTAMIIPFLLAAGQNLSREGGKEAWVRKGFLAAVPLSALTVVATNSRGAFLALAVGTLTWILLQKRKVAALVGLTLLLLIAVPFIPTQAGYGDRLGSITTYDETGDGSALGRIHFWNVATDIARAHPLGIGLQNFQFVYDDFDFSGGAYGAGRAVHSSHFQVLAETGFAGAVVWIALFAYASFVCLRTRRRALTSGCSPDDERFLFTMSNALLASMSSFLVGGAFLALALNDLTWLTFGLISALDRLSAKLLASPATVPVEIAPAFRATAAAAAGVDAGNRLHA